MIMARWITFIAIAFFITSMILDSLHDWPRLTALFQGFGIGLSIGSNLQYLGLRNRLMPLTNDKPDPEQEGEVKL